MSLGDTYTALRSLEKAFISVEVKEANSIKTALPILLQEKFDCVLLDYLLPDGKGTDLLKQLPHYYRSCPTILLTGVDSDEVGLSALQAGAEDYLIKEEITPSSLKRSIRYAMERYARHTEFEELARKLQEANNALKEANEKLSSLAVTDSLTGIPNRRAFFARLEQLLGETRRGRKFALILGDIDHFKKLNDTFGHQVGDESLILIAQVLATTARETDFVSRYGGEEFCILLSDVEEDGAMTQAKRLHGAVRSLSNFRQTITMSFGVCVYQPGLDTADLLFRGADAALYHAKNMGRDRVVSYQEIQPRIKKLGPTKSHTAN